MLLQQADSRANGTYVTVKISPSRALHTRVSVVLTHCYYDGLVIQLDDDTDVFLRSIGKQRAITVGVLSTISCKSSNKAGVIGGSRSRLAEGVSWRIDHFCCFLTDRGTEETRFSNRLKMVLKFSLARFCWKIGKIID